MSCLIANRDDDDEDDKEFSSLGDVVVVVVVVVLELIGCKDEEEEVDSLCLFSLCIRRYSSPKNSFEHRSHATADFALDKAS